MRAKWATCTSTNVPATTSAWMSARGVASGQWMYQSMQESKWQSGGRKGWSRAHPCRVTLMRWQVRHVFSQQWTSMFMWGQTYLWVISLCDFNSRMTDIVKRVKYSSWKRNTNGLGELVAESQTKREGDKGWGTVCKTSTTSAEAIIQPSHCAVARSLRHSRGGDDVTVATQENVSAEALPRPLTKRMSVVNSDAVVLSCWTAGQLQVVLLRRIRLEAFKATHSSPSLLCDSSRNYGLQRLGQAAHRSHFL